MDRHPFDVLYLERLRAGDADTERHFCAYFNDLIRLKVRARGMAAFFDDIRQETFLRVLRTVRDVHHGLRDPGALGAFVNSVCGNVMLETGRSRKTSNVEPPLSDERPDPGPSAESQFLTEERRFAVRSVIDSLEPRDRELLAAVFLEEQDRDQVCERMGVTREYLRVLLHRAKLAFSERYRRQTQQPVAAQPASATTIERRNG